MIRDESAGGQRSARGGESRGTNVERDPILQLSVTHATHGRIRLKIHTRRGEGHLQRAAGLLHHLPHVDGVRVNHAARSVTLVFDPHSLTGPRLIEGLCQLGLTVLELPAPATLGPVLAQRVAPQVANPATLSGRAHATLMAASGGRLNLVRVVAGFLVLVAALDGRSALLRGAGLPWARVLTYLSVAASLWTASLAGPPSDRGPAPDGASLRNAKHLNA